MYANTDSFTDQFFTIWDDLNNEQSIDTEPAYEPDTNDDGFWDDWRD